MTLPHFGWMMRLFIATENEKINAALRENRA
jgi:hypothetical protein